MGFIAGPGGGVGGVGWGGGGGGGGALPGGAIGFAGLQFNGAFGSYFGITFYNP